MSDNVQVPGLDPKCDWKQDAISGWWSLNGHEVLLINLEMGFISVAKLCPWQVDVDMNWANLVMNPGGEPSAQPSQSEPPAVGRNWPEIVAGVAGVILTVAFLVFCMIPTLAQCGIVRLPG